MFGATVFLKAMSAIHTCAGSESSSSVTPSPVKISSVAVDTTPPISFEEILSGFES